MFQVIYILGVMASSISGALKGGKHNLDVFGVAVIGLTTGLGGGVLRDVIMNQLPFAVKNEWVVYVSLGVSILAFYFSDKVKYYYKVVKTLDAAGLAVFVIIGADKGIDNGLGILGIAIMATLTGAVGGLLRDIFVREVPYIFKEDVYASLCMVSGAIYGTLVLYTDIDRMLLKNIAVICIFAVRVVTIKYNIHLSKKIL
ncbi:TRIC cation channel family protein [Fusobacteria bacterium ZRK30]|nr:TRIC cation channel family protein [Fusobacteria bacterium ZRK30]